MTGTYALAVQRNVIGRLAATIGAAVALLGTFLPWLRSGSRRRNSYEIFSLVDRLGISQSSLVGWGLRLWPVVPFLLALAVTLQWFPRQWLGGIAAIAAAVYVGGVAAAVRTAPATSLIAVEYGPSVTIAGIITFAIGVVTGAIGRGIRAPRGG
jgi:hypothetical protein